MSSTSSSVSAEPTLGGASASGRATPSGRFGGSQGVGSATTGLLGSADDLWRRTLQDAGGGGSSGGAPRDQSRSGGRSPSATPLMIRQAASFAAAQSSVDGLFPSQLFLSDTMRGIGVYEFNMKLMTGAPPNLGRVYSGYS